MKKLKLSERTRAELLAGAQRTHASPEEAKIAYEKSVNQALLNLHLIELQDAVRGFLNGPVARYEVLNRFDPIYDINDVVVKIERLDGQKIEFVEKYDAFPSDFMKAQLMLVA